MELAEWFTRRVISFFPTGGTNGGTASLLPVAPGLQPSSAESGHSPELLTLPLALQNAVAVEMRDEHTKIYVSQAVAGSPLFLTWVSRNRDRGLSIAVEQVGVDEIADYRSQFGVPTQSLDQDLLFRKQALELLQEAAGYNASDMHIKTNGQYADVQIEVKGELKVLRQMPHEEGETLIRVLYQGVAQTKSDSFKPGSYQNAQIPGSVFEKDVPISSIRMVRGPCYPTAEGGSFATLRLQYAKRTGAAPRVEIARPALVFPKGPPGALQLLKMGYTERQLEKLNMLMAAPSGIVLFTGPTGSGKTTTMFECLSDLARRRPWDRQVTVEDPVEYPMDWAVQLGLTDSKSDAEAGAAFMESVRVMLRMAPKIILIGEIRGAEVASAAMNAAITGHLVISTLHVNDPYLFVERFEFMDRERLHRGIFCDSKIVRGVIAQRLIPRLCPDCRIPYAKAGDALPHRILSALQTYGAIDHVSIRGHGCQRCAGDGSLGRAALAEIVVMDDLLASEFIEHGTSTARQNYRARDDADPSMLESAIAHVLRGDVDPRAVEKNVDLILPRK